MMTFEARDSAAKVVPARFKVSNGRSRSSNGPGSRRTTSKQIFRKNTNFSESSNNGFRFRLVFFCIIVCPPFSYDRNSWLELKLVD